MRMQHLTYARHSICSVPFPRHLVGLSFAHPRSFPLRAATPSIIWIKHARGVCRLANFRCLALGVTRHHDEEGYVQLRFPIVLQKNWRKLLYFQQ